MVAMTTFIVSGPKRSGTSLLNRLFDSQPGLVDMSDEAFFWEHAYRYDEAGHADLFLDLFKAYTPAALTEGFIDRDLLPWIEGRYRQAASFREFELDLGFDTGGFTRRLELLKNCTGLQEIWHALVDAYAESSAKDYSVADKVLMKTADYGMSILSARRFLDRARFVFILRNPYFALDSLKKSREMRGEKILHPFNFGEALRDYIFFWENRKEILGADTILILYEDLLTRSREVMEKVASHLGVAFSENLLAPTLAGRPWPGHSSFRETRNIEASVLDRPLQVLRSEEIALIRSHLSDLSETYGYGPERQCPARGLT